MPLKDLFNLSLNRLGCTDFYRKKKSVCCQIPGCFGDPHLPARWHIKCTPLTPEHSICSSQCWWLARSVTWAAFFNQDREGFVCLFVLCLQWPWGRRHTASAWALPFCFGHVSFPYPCPPVVERSNPWKTLLGDRQMWGADIGHLDFHC